jgi:hypothetical protein
VSTKAGFGDDIFGRGSGFGDGVIFTEEIADCRLAKVSFPVLSVWKVMFVEARLD